MTRLALVAETQSIWDEAHVRIRWVGRDEDAAGTPLLPVLVMARVVPAAGDAAPLTVGELVRREGARAMAIASITGARRIVDESQRFWLLDPPTTHD